MELTYIYYIYLKGEIQMKKETEKKKKIIKEIKSNIIKITILIILIMVVYLFSNYTIENRKLSISTYPEETYKTMEEDASNILDDSNQYIDIEKLSNKNIEYSIDYYLSDNESDSNWKVELKEGNLSVYATVIKSSDDKLLVEKIERSMTQSEYDKEVKAFIELKIVIKILLIIASILTLLGILIFSLDTFYQIKEYRQFQKSK